MSSAELMAFFFNSRKCVLPLWLQLASQLVG